MALQKFVQNDNNLAVAYYRYSSNAQSETSITQQRKAAHEFADSHGWTIIREYEDYAKSGTDDKRPGYQAMLSEVGKLRPAYIITWKLDRLNRNTIDFFLGLRTMIEAGTALRFVMEPNIGNQMDALLTYSIGAWNAEKYSRNLSDNIIRGQTDIANAALYAGYKILGYAAEPAPEHGKHRQRYVIDPLTAPVVERIFRDYTDGKPLVEIARELNAQGLRTSRGNAFTINGLRQVLKNDAYIGIYRYRGVEIQGGMPVIVSKDVFDRAQARFSQNKRDGSKRANAVDDAPRYWLTGKLFCGRCGSAMQGMCGTSKTQKKRHYYYACKGQRHHACNKKAVRKEDIEERVLKTLKMLLSDNATIASLAVDIAAHIRSERIDNSDRLEMLYKSKKEIERRLNNLVEAIMDGLRSETTQEALQKLETEKKALSDAIECEERIQALADDETSIRRFFEEFQHADLDDTVVRDYLLEHFIDKIYVYDDKIVITCYYGGDTREVEWELVDGAVEKEAAEGSTASLYAPPVARRLLIRSQSNGSVFLCSAA